MPFLAGRGLATSGVEYSRIIGLDGDAPCIWQRPFRFDAERLPLLSSRERDRDDAVQDLPGGRTD